jgi:circadian clock protein KaiB
MPNERSSFSVRAYDAAIEKAAARQQSFRLYIAGNTPTSIRAVRNAKRLCDAHFPGHYRLMVVDIHQRPELAKSDHILATPTLVRSRPSPARRLIGDLSDETRFCANLGIPNQCRR